MDALEPILWAAFAALSLVFLQRAAERLTFCPRDRHRAWHRARTMEARFRRATADGNPSASRYAVAVLIALDRCDRIADGGQAAMFLTAEEQHGDWQPTGRVAQLMERAVALPAIAPVRSGPPYRS